MEIRSYQIFFSRDFSLTVLKLLSVPFRSGTDLISLLIVVVFAVVVVVLILVLLLVVVIGATFS